MTSASGTYSIKTVLSAFFFVFIAAFSTMVVMVPHASASVAPAAYEKCNASREVYDSGQDGYFKMPARGSSVSCWLAYDRSYSNPAVSRLQTHIKLCYIDTGRISWSGGFASDGYFGDDTLNALKKIQNRHGVGADGEYGPTTRDVMFLRWGANPGGSGRVGCSNSHNF
ncbi:peptidoglycan-binding domain-containing protein [Promicromonospora vindobonensis]|uniref:Peptidoglycan-binding domain-containing protein n=1 Tax=Promicromonospora vindobonensis TaxID=195748 RepID=A0ABW5VNV8_9MICO